jgi:hypothetical protein
MEPAAKKSFGEKFGSNAKESGFVPADGIFMDERDLGSDLSEDNFTLKL